MAANRYVRYSVPAMLYFTVIASPEDTDEQMEASARRTLADLPVDGGGLEIDGWMPDAVVWVGNGSDNFDPATVALSVEDMGEDI